MKEMLIICKFNTSLINIINQKFFISGFKGLLHRSPNMDTLVSLGATASFSYSVYTLFVISNAVVSNNTNQMTYFMNPLLQVKAFL